MARLGEVLFLICRAIKALTPLERNCRRNFDHWKEKVIFFLMGAFYPPPPGKKSCFPSNLQKTETFLVYEPILSFLY